MRRQKRMDDFAQLNIDRLNEKELKTEEQLKRHTIDPNIEKKPIERALYLLSNGEEIQRIAVIENLPTILKNGDFEQAVVTRVIPKMVASLQYGSSELQIVTAQVYSELIRKRMISVKNIVQSLIPMIKIGLEMRELIVAESWLGTMIDCIENLPQEVIHNEIEKFVIKRSEIATPYPKRAMVPLMMKSIAQRYDKKLFRGLVDCVERLSRDPDKKIRTAVSESMVIFAEKMTSEDLKDTFVKCLLILIGDEDYIVALAAIESFSELLDNFKSNEIKSKFIPNFKKIYDAKSFSKPTETERLLLLANRFGKICNACSEILIPADKSFLIATYQYMSRVGSTRLDRDTLQAEKYVEIRQKCADNFPEMLFFATSAGEDYAQLLHNTFRELCLDPHMGVRKVIASELDAISMLMTSQIGIVKTEITTMLKNDNEEVLVELMKVFIKVLNIIKKLRGPNENLSNEFGQAIIKCESNVRNSRNWRLTCDILKILEQSPQFFPSDYIFNSFVPLVYWHLFMDRPLTVRMSAGQALLGILRNNMRQAQRNDINLRINVDLASSTNCYKRQMYLRMMKMAMYKFSAQYFKANYFLYVIKFTRDKVCNVRLMMMNLLPNLYRMLRIPSDNPLLNEFQKAVAIMKEDPDRDIKAIYFKVKDRISKPIPADGVHFDFENQKLFDEERKIESNPKFQSAVVVFQGSGGQMGVQRTRRVNARQSVTPAAAVPAPPESPTGSTVRTTSTPVIPANRNTSNSSNSRQSTLEQTERTTKQSERRPRINDERKRRANKRS